MTDLAFTSDGLLPAHDFHCTLSQLAESMLVKGPKEWIDGWDEAWRRLLVQNLGLMAGQLWQVGIGNIYVNGSFVEDKPHPNDIDGYFACDLSELASGRLEEALNRIDPHKVWTWDPDARREFRGYPKKQLPMWHQYRVELYPHYQQGTGVRDDFGHDMEFPSLFRQQRHSGKPKGIIVLTNE
jgi:hypothetical protein